MAEFKKGDRVRFMAGPRSHTSIDATVTKVDDRGPGKGGGVYLHTRDEGGFERKVRPAACTKVVG